MTQKHLQALAKMLPEKLKFESGHLFYLSDVEKGWIERLVHPTELLHLCWLVEEALSRESGAYGQEYSQRDDYAKELMKLCGTWKGPDWDWGSSCDADLFEAAHATPEQRIEALAKVKGIEV